MALMTFENYADIANLKTSHPGTSINVAATILGPDFPFDESYTVYHWDFWDETTPDDDEVVKPTAVNPQTGTVTDYGRWLKVDLATAPQINTDWNAVTGAPQLLNKPTLHTVATSGSYNDLANKPSIPSSPVNSDWNAGSGLAQILNKPTVPGSVVVGSPNTRSLSLATAYQATDTSKPAIVTLNLNSAPAISLGGGTTNIGEIRIGSANTVASGSGTAVGAYKSAITGTLVLGVALTLDTTTTSTFVLPAGWYFAVRQTTGSGLTVVSAFDQSISN